MSEFSLKQIQVFVAVAELGSFTQAAQALFLSQSTVSAHLAALETALSTRLLDRDARRRVRLTPEGERVYPAAKKSWRTALHSRRSSRIRMAQAFPCCWEPPRYRRSICCRSCWLSI